ncbi:MAG: hypothetical protein ACKVPX_07315 [Myxococcaceae bacterium]
MELGGWSIFAVMDEQREMNGEDFLSAKRAKAVQRNSGTALELRSGRYSQPAATSRVRTRCPMASAFQTAYGGAPPPDVPSAFTGIEAFLKDFVRLLTLGRHRPET